MVQRAGCLAVMLFISIGCNFSAPKATLVSVEQVETINVNGVFYQWEGKDNIKIILDLKFDENIVSDLDQESDEYRGELYGILVNGAHFYHQDQEAELTWGYWPKKAGSDFAKELKLFYVAPTDRAASSLKFVYDGTVLGEGGIGIDTIISVD